MEIPLDNSRDGVKSHGDLQQVLKDVFGYQQFRGLQKQAVDHVVHGQDVLLLMPTGGGKSVCYQIPLPVSFWYGAGGFPAYRLDG